MAKEVEVRFRVPRGPYTVIVTAARLRGMTVTAFYNHAVMKELESSGDYKRLTSPAVAHVYGSTVDALRGKQITEVTEPSG